MVGFLSPIMMATIASFLLLLCGSQAMAAPGITMKEGLDLVQVSFTAMEIFGPSTSSFTTQLLTVVLLMVVLIFAVIGMLNVLQGRGQGNPEKQESKPSGPVRETDRGPDRPPQGPLVVIHQSSAPPGGVCPDPPHPSSAPAPVLRRPCPGTVPGIEYGLKTVPELKDMLRKRGLQLSGNKVDLVARLREADIKDQHLGRLHRD